MFLPDYVRICIDALEQAGFAAYAVGGCVRDALLGLTPSDYDLCTAATPEQTKAVFSHCRLVLAGEKHGTVTVITEEGNVEITTFRTEGDYSDSRHPSWVHFVDRIEEDLARRDFTVNAMAYSPTRGFADPFGGREDLDHRILRAVGDPKARFREDALRILRGMRFAVRYRLAPEENTLRAMFCLAEQMDFLAPERIFEELCKLLPLVTGADLIRFSPVLTQVIPELAPAIGFDQRNPHHAYDLFTHIARVTGNAPADLTLRWAALLHDVGKIPCFHLDERGIGRFHGHASKSAEMADAVLLRLKAPTALRKRVTQLISQHMTLLVPERKLLLRWMRRFGSGFLWQLLALQQSDRGSKGTDGPEDTLLFQQTAQLLQELEAESACFSLKDLAVNGRDLMALGYEGPAVGRCLDRLLELVMDGALPNEKSILLTQAEQDRKEVTS